MSTAAQAVDGEGRRLTGKLRVAVLNRIFAPTGGGAERYSIALVEQLADRHEMHVFAQRIAHQWPGVTYHAVPTLLQKPRWLNQLWFAAWTWWVTRRGFDIVHSHENTWHGNVQTVHVLPVKHNLFKDRHGLLRMARCLKVLTSPRLIVYLLLERSRFARVPLRQIVVTSDSLGDVMAATYPGCASALSVVTPGFDLPAHFLTEDRGASQRRAREQFGLPSSGVCLLLVANDFRKKGLTTILEALAKLPPHHVLAVVGNPAQIPAFEAQISRLNLTSRVFFVGQLPDVANAYGAADYLIHPTLEDTFAMAVLEAMAFGLPVLVSGAQFCGIAGLLQHQVNAWLLDDPRDADSLIQAVQTLDANAGLRQMLSDNAMRFAAGYQWKDIAQRQEAVYLAAAGLT
jgi:glycosyltransferase involved in cell wall biosynthesis